MIKIITNRSKCQISGELNVGNIRELDDELSFFIKGAEHSKAFKGYYRGDKFVNWDGRKRLLTSDMCFPHGLLERVQEFYNKRNIPFELVDARPKMEPAYPIDIFPKLNSIEKSPYPYQIDAVNKAKEKSCGIIRSCTGSGKTLIALMLTAALGKNTIIYVIGKDLLYQIHNLFSSVFEQPIGLIGDGHCDIHDINIATIWSVGQALGLKKTTKAEDEGDEKKPPPQKYKDIRNMLGKMRVHILDECHLAACDTVQEIAKRVNPENVYGMSASPWRDDGADLLIESFLGKPIVDIPAKFLIEQGYLARPIIRFLPVPKLRGAGQKYQSIYKNYVVENQARNEMVVKGAVKLVEQNFQTLVLFNSLKHGKILYDLISKQMPCEILSGDDSSKRREEVKNKLENKELNCVIASKIFDIGVDMPSLSGLIIGSAGKSSVRALQRVGRVIRKYPGKTHAAVIDFYDQAKYLKDHSYVRKNIYEMEFDVQWPFKKSD